MSMRFGNTQSQLLYTIVSVKPMAHLHEHEQNAQCVKIQEGLKRFMGLKGSFVD